jgi:hypothetical protein
VASRFDPLHPTTCAAIRPKEAGETVEAERL